MTTPFNPAVAAPPIIVFGTGVLSTRDQVLDVAHLLSLLETDSLVTGGFRQREQRLPVEVTQLTGRILDAVHDQVLPPAEAARAVAVARDIADGGDRALAGQRILDADLHDLWAAAAGEVTGSARAVPVSWRQTPPGAFPDMPTLRAVTVPAEFVGLPAPTRAAFFEQVAALDERLYHELGYDPNGQWWRETLQRVADIHATLDVARDQHLRHFHALRDGGDPAALPVPFLSAREIDCATRVVAGMLHGDHIGGDRYGSSLAIARTDAFQVWTTGRRDVDYSEDPLTLSQQRAVADYVELNHAIHTRREIDEIDERTGTFTIAPGLRPLTGVVSPVGEPVNGATFASELRELIDEANDAVNSGNREVIDETQAWAASLLGHFTANRQVWPLEQRCRAAVMLAHVAATARGEETRAQLAPYTVWKAIEDDGAFRAFLRRRNESLVQEVYDTLDIGSGTGQMRLEMAVLGPDPITLAQNANRRDEMFERRAAAVDAAGEFLGFSGLRPVSIDSDMRPRLLWRPGDFEGELHRLDNEKLDPAARHRAVCDLVSTIRDGWHLEPATAVRAEVMLAAIDAGAPPAATLPIMVAHSTPGTVPPLERVIHDQAKFEGWQARRDAEIKAGTDHAEIARLLTATTATEAEVRTALAGATVTEVARLHALLQALHTPQPAAAHLDAVAAAVTAAPEPAAAHEFPDPAPAEPVADTDFTTDMGVA